ncbi:sigma-70 family RNA polymerase sigma factor [soil metagenome]
MKTIYGDEDDDRLMARAAKGDHDAFGVIVRRHQHRLQRFAARMLGRDPSRAADVAVGALLRLWETRANYRAHGRLGAWLTTATYRLCLDALDDPRTGRETEFDETELSDAGCFPLEIEREALGEAVRTAVLELPPSHRAVVVLSVYEGMGYDAIADALEISAGTVASRKNHAIALLRRRLAAWREGS